MEKEKKNYREVVFRPGRTLDKTKFDAPHRRRAVRGLWRRKRRGEKKKNKEGR